jgi:hypothetical protein
LLSNSYVFKNKIKKNKKCHTLGKVSKYDKKIKGKGKFDTTVIHAYLTVLFWLGTCIPITSGGIR